MKRILVVGPGPSRPGVGPAASTASAELADAFAAAGLVVAALDASPTSALLWPEQPRRRYVEPLDIATVRRVVELERTEAITVRAAGPAVVRALAGEVLTGLAWLGGSPQELTAAKRDEPAPEGAIVDVVAASDGKSAEVLAALSCGSPAHVALADGEHTVLSDVPRELLEIVGARVAGSVGLVTLRCVAHAGRYEVVSADPIDPVLWPAAGLVRGVVPGELLARLLLGDTVEAALAHARRPARALRKRVPCFDFDPYPGVDRTLGGIPKSLGATHIGEETAVPPAGERRRVVVVGPGPVRAGQGAEASLALALAAREVTRLGHDAVVVTSREGTGADRSAARVHLTGDAAAVIAREAPSDVLLGFGASSEALMQLEGRGTDLGARFDARARELEAGPPAPDAIEVHVLVLSDGAGGKVVGTFEHVERAAVHPEDAAAVFPSLAVDERALRDAEERAVALAPELGVKGLFTARFAVRDAPLLVGASAGVTTHALSLGLVLGVDLVAEAVRVALGGPLEPAPFKLPRHVAVEEHVFPFAALGASDTRLDRRPRSTGTVLALGETVARAYARALASMGVSLRRPAAGGEPAVLLAGAVEHAVDLADVGRRLYALGFEIVATQEAASWLERARVPHRRTADGASLVSRRGVVAVVATADAGAELRHAALVAGVTCFTTVDLIKVAVRALELDDAALTEVRSLEDWAKR